MGLLVRVGDQSEFVEGDGDSVVEGHGATLGPEVVEASRVEAFLEPTSEMGLDGEVAGRANEGSVVAESVEEGEEPDRDVGLRS